MRNLSLWIKCSFLKINFAFFCPHSFILHSLSLVHISEVVIRTEMRKLFSENNFFGNICYLIFHINISEINISAA